jgi:hypothetical protein
MTMQACNLTNDHLPLELTELCRRVEALPRRGRGQLLPLCNWLSEWAHRQNRLVQAAQETVDQLQLDVKYLRFDLDCTRSERDAFRRELESD